MATRVPRWLLVGALAFVLGLPLASAAAAGDKPLTVVELFTSQGCSSCPPADAYLGELAQRPDVLALSEHVDYWDYIGWKDAFASPEITRRQRSYAKTLGMRYVYTPQMVIQGMTHATGSDRDAVERLIDEYADLPRHPVGVEVGDGGFTVVVPGAHVRETATVWLAVFDDRQQVAVRSGENAGRTLVYRNVVRAMTKIGTWEGGGLRIAVDAAEMTAAGRDGCAVLLQGDRTGRILGAARVSL